ncbi:MAG: amino acid permease [Desulfovibrio sp.]|uniref:amino acid permease n=1 Tax=Desulfovibrio sp. 7SRBS1 TaxID=3378064 RepID=UPI003B3D94EE
MSEIKKKMGLLGFFSITGSMIMTVYSYPAFASSGFSLIFFLLFAGLLYFVPTALISAEMATGEGWEVGGVYTWCSVAFGRRWGFMAIFLQWLQITVGFVTMLYFVVGALSYFLNWPALNESPMLKFLSVMVLFWGVTMANMRGTGFTERLSTLGLLFGVSLPALLLVILAVLYLVQGHPVHVDMSFTTFFPDFTNIHTLVILVAFILSYAGIEASAVHVNELKNAQRNYPLAIIILTVFAIVVNILGAMSIAIVIPAGDINMSAGVVQAFQELLNIFHMGWVVYPIALLLAMGAIAEVSAWVVGPSHGLYTAALDGILPACFKKKNSKDVPVNLILAQGVVVSLWAVILTFGGGGANMSFLLAISLTVLTYLVMYILLFMTYIKLKEDHADVKRSFVVPGGKRGQRIIPLIGLGMVIFSLVVSFFPPSQIAASNDGTYETILVAAFMVVLILPHLIYGLRKESNKEPFELHRLDFGHHRVWWHPRGRHPFAAKKYGE